MAQVDKNNNIYQNNQLQPTIDLSRFGHSMTLCNKILLKKSFIIIVNTNNSILFGGVKGYSSNYNIKNDTYIFKLQENAWVKITPSVELPPPRAAHSVCAK